MRRLLYVVAIFIFHLADVQAQTGEITGRVTDDKGEGLPFANVVAEEGGKLVNGAQTDFDGYYVIKPLAPGRYDVRVTYLGEDKSVTKGVQVSSDKITTLNLTATAETQLGEVKIIQYRNPLIDADNNSTKTTITSEEIMRVPTRDVNSIASLSAGVYQSDEGGGLNIKGAREDGTEYYIDGMRVRGSTKIPAQGIEELTIITGGVPAKYGDATGGIVSITTRGPSPKFGGSVEGITSQGMDAYGYNLGSFDLTGPIYKKNKGTENERSVIGYFISGEYLRHQDRRPSAVGVYTVKPDVLRYLEQNPLVPSPVSEVFIPTSETITTDALENVKTKPNVVSNNYTLSGKVDVRATETINLTFGGNFNYLKYHNWVDRYTMFNYVNNPLFTENTWRVYGRFTQRFGQKAYDETETSGRKNTFQNAFYSVQFDYTKDVVKSQDDNHGFRAFDYGYHGAFDILQTPVFEYGVDEISGKSGYKQVAIRDTLVRFSPSNVNPTGTAFTNRYFELAGAEFVDGWWTAPFPGAQRGFYENLPQVQSNGGRGTLNGDRPGLLHDIWFNTGRQYNGFGQNRDNEQYRLSVLGSVDIVPGGSARNKHAIEFGFEFDQRIDRGYQLNPIGLWEQMRLLANRHIDQLNDSIPYFKIGGQLYRYDDPNAPAFSVNDTIVYNRKYVAGDQTFFDRALRTKLGLPIDNTDFINTDMFAPNFYSLNMFSADDLLNNGNPFVSYFGYDHRGNRLTKEPSFEDFFRLRDENGDYIRPIGSFRPIYSSVFIQDKFNFKDLLFNIGLRVDRFDANQKVLRDPYLLYPAYTVGEGAANLDRDVPGNIGNDYIIYVDDFSKENPTPVGYRTGNRWFNSEGVEVNDPRILATSSSTGLITPYLTDPNTTRNKIKDPDFDVSGSFQDYEPQITWMPRIAFQFNLTDEASFFAHYDILAQRPPGRIRTGPDRWYYFNEYVNNVSNNPALKPERTIDYQLGFRQLLTRNSAVTVSAFYREMKDMIQIINIPYAFPGDYRTFGNVDFGTVKGFTVAYDLRSTGTSNFSLRLNYTIQWAEGTGSSQTSQFNLINSGQPNLRTIVPLSFDSRHNINATMNYGYGEGANYNGPKIKDKEIFANAGANLIVRARSGEPYTQQENPTAEALRSQATRKILTGSINGSRLPWRFTLDLRVWKDFKLNNFKTKPEGEASRSPKKTYYLNTYLLVQNLLNTLNIVSVYPYTGNPGDDGYLTSDLGQQDLTNQINAAAYSDMYMAYLDSGYDGVDGSRFALPRSVRLGMIFKF